MAFPFNLFKKNKFEPKIYLLNCSECGYSEEVELQGKDVKITTPAEEVHKEQYKTVSALPKKCPNCTFKLKKKQIPVMIRY